MPEFFFVDSDDVFYVFLAQGNSPKQKFLQCHDDLLGPILMAGWLQAIWPSKSCCLIANCHEDSTKKWGLGSIVSF